MIENPAFDVTPNRYVTAIITERGVARAPYTESLAFLHRQSGSEQEFVRACLFSGFRG